MRWYKFIGLLGIGWMLAFAVVAKELALSLRLVDIQVVRTAQEKKDEVYFDITYYTNSKNSETQRIPVYPMHWVSNQISQAKNALLWKGHLKEGQSIKLIVSLIEQNARPWEVDTLLGSAELVLANLQGVLKQEWSVPHFEPPPVVEIGEKASPQRYVFKGANSRYDVAFMVEQN